MSATCLFIALVNNERTLVLLVERTTAAAAAERVRLGVTFTVGCAGYSSEGGPTARRPRCTHPKDEVPYPSNHATLARRARGNQYQASRRTFCLQTIRTSVSENDAENERRSGESIIQTNRAASTPPAHQNHSYDHRFHWQTSPTSTKRVRWQRKLTISPCCCRNCLDDVAG